MPLLPDDPQMRRFTISQLMGFIGIPVIVVLGLMVFLATHAPK
jgi:hypothetical protein